MRDGRAYDSEKDLLELWRQIPNQDLMNRFRHADQMVNGSMTSGSNILPAMDSSSEMIERPLTNPQYSHELLQRSIFKLHTIREYRDQDREVDLSGLGPGVERMGRAGWT